MTMYHPLTGEPISMIVDNPPTPDKAKIIDMKGRTFTPRELEKGADGDRPKRGPAPPFKRPRAVINGKIITRDQVIEGKTLIIKSHNDYSFSDEKPDPKKYDITDAKNQLIVLTVNGRNAAAKKLKKYGLDFGYLNAETGDIEEIYRAPKGKK